MLELASQRLYGTQVLLCSFLTGTFLIGLQIKISCFDVTPLVISGRGFQKLWDSPEHLLWARIQLGALVQREVEAAQEKMTP